jgi:hypothetical protein
MPDGIEEKDIAGASAAAADGARVSRRSMLMGAAGAGAAGVAVAALGGAAFPAAAGATAAGPAAGRQAAELSPAELAEPVVVHVRDAARGDIEVFRGTTSTQLRDRDLAARLVRAAAS